MEKTNEYISEIIRKESEAISNIPINNNFEKAVDLIYSRVHVGEGKLVTSGIGKAGQVAHSIGTVLCSTGTPSVFIHPSEAQHGDLGLISENDILLLISNSGKTREILEIIELTKRLHSKIPFIVITGNVSSELGNLVDVIISTGNPDEICPLGLAPTTSTTIMSVIGDILVALMMKKINFTNEDYAKRHHGGYLGSKSRSRIK